MSIRLLIVDDDQYNRRGLADIFAATTDIEVAGDADDGDQVLDAYARYSPDVVLMDLKMRRVGGLDAIAALMRLTLPPKVIAMTALDVDDLVVRVIAAGAQSFLSKDEPPEAFHQSVRAVAAGNMLFSRESLARIVSAANRSSPIMTSELESLTPREREVLVAVASGATNADIGASLYMGETTVKTHVSSIMTKLGVRNRVEAALIAFRAQWVR